MKSASGDDKSESYRSALAKVWQDYVQDHYPDGVGVVSTT